ncbi:unnamed protein product [Ectocarpus sp. 4 AP-2014]
MKNDFPHHPSSLGPAWHCSPHCTKGSSQPPVTGQTQARELTSHIPKPTLRVARSTHGHVTLVPMLEAGSNLCNTWPCHNSVNARSRFKLVQRPARDLGLGTCGWYKMVRGREARHLIVSSVSLHVPELCSPSCPLRYSRRYLSSPH